MGSLGSLPALSLATVSFASLAHYLLGSLPADDGWRGGRETCLSFTCSSKVVKRSGHDQENILCINDVGGRGREETRLVYLCLCVNVYLMAFIFWGDSPAMKMLPAATHRLRTYGALRTIMTIPGTPSAPLIPSYPPTIPPIIVYALEVE